MRGKREVDRVMAGTHIRIEGLEDCLRMFRGAPKEMQKAGRKAMAAAARKVTAGMRRTIPARWKKLLKSVAKMTRGGDFYATMGLYNRQERNGKQPKGKPVSDWFKAYWADYGTLERRDPNHKFDYPVKGKNTANGRLRRNDKGQYPEGFFEDAIDGWEAAFFDEFRRSLEQQGYKI